MIQGVRCEKVRRCYLKAQRRAGSAYIYVCSVLVACGGSVRSIGTMAYAEWHSYRHEVCVDGARMGVACVWMARMWATRVGGAGVCAIAFGSACGCASYACIGSWHGLSGEGASGPQLLG